MGLPLDRHSVWSNWNRDEPSALSPTSKLDTPQSTSSFNTKTAAAGGLKFLNAIASSIRKGKLIKEQMRFNRASGEYNLALIKQQASIDGENIAVGVKRFVSAQKSQAASSGFSVSSGSTQALLKETIAGAEKLWLRRKTRRDNDLARERFQIQMTDAGLQDGLRNVDESQLTAIGDLGLSLFAAAGGGA